MFGIKGYNPKFYSNCKDFLFHNRGIIRQMIGQELENVYWVWEKNTEDWFKDYPVVIKLTNGYYSLCANRHSDFAIGLNNIDFDKKLNWYRDQDFQLEWKEYNTRTLTAMVDREIQSVEIVNFLPRFLSQISIPDKRDERIVKKMGFLHGMGFQFETKTMVVTNGIEDNNIVFFEHHFPNYYTRIIINE